MADKIFGTTFFLNCTESTMVSCGLYHDHPFDFVPYLMFIGLKE